MNLVTTGTPPVLITGMCPMLSTGLGTHWELSQCWLNKYEGYGRRKVLEMGWDGCVDLDSREITTF